jgi:putative ABC transport system permease protein
LVEGTPESTISVYTYVIANIRRHKLRYGLTIFGLVVCVIFFIIIASLSIGLYEHLEPETTHEEVTPEPIREDPEVVNLDKNVKQTIVNWLYFTSVLIFATAVAGVANTMLMSMTERKREIGILKSVGFTKKEIVEIFLTESLMICLFSWAFGTILGLYLSNNVFNYLKFPGSSNIFFATMRTPPVILFAAFIIVFVVGLLASILPALRAARLTPVNALKG